MRKLNLILNLFIAVLAIAFCYVAYLVFWPVKVADYNQPYKVRPNIVEAGQTLTYTTNYCKYIDVPPTVSRTLIDGTVIYFPTETTNLPTGCNKKDVQLVIPKNTPPGVYHIEITLTYKVNPLKEVTSRILTDEFRVTNVCLTEKGC